MWGGKVLELTTTSCVLSLCIHDTRTSTNPVSHETEDLHCVRINLEKRPIDVALPSNNFVTQDSIVVPRILLFCKIVRILFTLHEVTLSIKLLCCLICC